MHPSAAPAIALWPPDDTEESVVGTPFHQGTIGNVRFGINEAAAARPGHPAPWQANSQGLILGLRRRDGSRYQVLPDIYVYRTPFELDRGSMSLAQDGPPDLVIEMLSESTWESDVDLERGKAWSYGDAGVAEYLILDPGGAYLRGAQGRGWRLSGGAYAPWEPDARGRWASGLGFSIGYDGPWAMVWGPDERLVPREGQVLRLLDKRRAEGVEQGRAAGLEEGRVQGVEQGRVAGARALLLRVLSSRFGPLPAIAVARVAALDSIAALEPATEAALHAADLHAFLTLLDATG